MVQLIHQTLFILTMLGRNTFGKFYILLYLLKWYFLGLANLFLDDYEFTVLK